MKQYLEMLKYIIQNGVEVPTRAKLQSTGENINAISVVGYQNRYDLSQGFPLLTTKKLSFKNIVSELCWFLRGDTNVAFLHHHNNHIWDQWVKPDGTIGDGYGKQWRHWENWEEVEVDNSFSTYQDIFTKKVLRPIDQIKDLIKGINEVKQNPLASVGRRLILTAWNPPDIPSMGLPPCHLLSQYTVRNGKLTTHMYQRSCDAFLGVPYNIASYALLTHILAAYTDLEVGEFIHTFHDLHIYTNHLDQVNEQLSRQSLLLPKLWLDREKIKNSDYLLEIQPEWFLIGDYNAHPNLKGEVAV